MFLKSYRYMHLKGKRIVLTGASSGIGRELLVLLSQYEGVKIIAVARHIDVIPEIKDGIFPFSADVSTESGIDSVFDYAESVFGEIDIFIANAGFAYLERLIDANWQHNEDIYKLNVFSPIYSLQRLVSSSAGKDRAFVCTVSGAAMACLPGYALYCSSKAALHQFIETYRYEKKENIQITAVYPVATRTDFFNKASGKGSTPLPFPQQSPEKVAKAIVRGIEKGKKRVFPSRRFRLFYPIGRAFPCLMRLYSLREKHKVANTINLNNEIN